MQIRSASFWRNIARCRYSAYSVSHWPQAQLCVRQQRLLCSGSRLLGLQSGNVEIAGGLEY
eukprot:2963333-Pleurochrysis_carterae.AAC.1